MPPIPEWLGGATGWLGALAALFLVLAFFWKPSRAAWKLLRSLYLFIEDWNGTPERRDHAGVVIEAARPGVPALLETVRSQVQNSHSTNLRDDVDVVRELVDRLAAKLDEHISIAKASDESQAETARQVERLATRWVES